MRTITPTVKSSSRVAGHAAARWARQQETAAVLDKRVLLTIAKAGRGFAVDPDEAELATTLGCSVAELHDSYERLTHHGLLVAGELGWLLGPNAA